MIMNSKACSLLVQLMRQQSNSAMVLSLSQATCQKQQGQQMIMTSWGYGPGLPGPELEHHMCADSTTQTSAALSKLNAPVT